MFKPSFLAILISFCCLQLKGQSTDSSLLPSSQDLFDQYLKSHEPRYGSQLALVMATANDLKEATERFIIANDADINFDWEFKLLKGKEANLVVLLGGKVIVFDQLLSGISNQNELACLMAYGIAHTLIEVNKNTSLKIYSRKLENITGFPENEEILADKVGAKIRALAGYDPQVGVHVWQEFQDSEYINYLDYHPFYEDKIINLQKFAADAKTQARSYGTTSFK